MSLSMNISCNADNAIRRMDQMIRRSQDFRPVFAWAKGYLKRANALNFTTSGLMVGGWDPLDARYAAWKGLRYPGKPILQQSGALFKSLSDLNGPENYMGFKRAEFGTSVEYAKFHQYGTSKMAKRQIVFEPPLFAKMLGMKAREHVVGNDIS